VDLEADPVIDRDNPPDLKQYADAAIPLELDDSTGGAAAAPAAKPAAQAAAAATGGKKAAAAEKKAAAAAAPAGPRADDVLRITDELVAKVGEASLKQECPSSREACMHQALPASLACLSPVAARLGTRTASHFCLVFPHPTPLVQVASTLLGDGAASVDSDVLRRLKADVEMQLNALRNAAYAGGFAAAKGAIAGAINGVFA
jgi:hypothetical protein